VDELPKVEALEPRAVLSIQRIVLEAITNTVRHSGAKRLRFAARQHGGHIEILIEDDGHGFDAAATPGGHGLASMRARAARLGGRIHIAAREGAGTTVRLLVPLQLPQDDSAEHEAITATAKPLW
jgi:signal transduction histidine kinase